jgi:hypothetical protein
MGSLRKQEADVLDAQYYDYDEHGQPKFGMQISEHGRWFLPPPRGWRPLPPQVPDDPREALSDLWAFGRLVYEEILLLWGAPSELMAKHWLLGREAILCRDWVRHLEHLVRAILLIAALTLELVLPRPRTQAKRMIDPDAAPRLRLMKVDDPSTWAVSLRMFPSEREPRQYTRRERRPARDYLDAASLAKRIEALYRILKRQDVYVTRLARRMARLREKNRLANAPRTLKLRPWTYPYDFYNRTSGQYAVQEQMTPAHFMASRLLGSWHDLEPG